MSVSTTTNRVSYTGNGATTAYTVPYQYYDQTHLKVYVNSVLQTLTTNYTVSPTTNTPHGTVGGTVTFLVAPGNGLNVLILRQVPNTQTATLQDLSLFPATTVEQMSDLLTFANQQQDETAGRAITIPVTSSLASVQIPDPAIAANQGLYLQTYSGGLQLASAPIGTTNPITTKGDLITSQGGSTPSRFAVGADGTVLKADSTQSAGIGWSNPAALDGARGLKVVPHVPGTLGTWVNSSTTFAAQSGNFNLFDGTAADGHIVGSSAQFTAVNYLVTTAASPTTVVYEYWNAAWTTLTTLATPTFSALGYTQLRFAVPGDWVIGGSGTGVPQTTYNVRIRQSVGTTTVVGTATLATRVDITADEVLASNGIQKIVTQSLGTITPDIRVAGPAANGRGQVGTFSTNSYVYLWLIYNPTTTTWAGVWDVSATAPGMPSGYTFKVRIGGYRIDANSVLLPWYQYGNAVTYPVGVTDLNAGTNASAVAITLTVPSTATEVVGNAAPTNGSGATAQALFSPEPFGVSGGNTVFQSVLISATGATATAGQSSIKFRLKIASTLYYAQGNAGTTVSFYTWGYVMPGNLS